MPPKEKVKKKESMAETTYYYKCTITGTGKGDVTSYRPDVPDGFKKWEVIDWPKGSTVCVIRVYCSDTYDTTITKQSGVTVATADTKV